MIGRDNRCTICNRSREKARTGAPPSARRSHLASSAIGAPRANVGAFSADLAPDPALNSQRAADHLAEARHRPVAG